MYQQIKEAAEAALKLQNKDEMDRTLRGIVVMCYAVLGDDGEQPSPALTVSDITRSVDLEMQGDALVVKTAKKKGAAK